MTAAARRFPKPAIPAFDPDDLRVTLLERHRLTADVTTYVFDVERSDGGPFRHHPGQFLSLDLPGTDGIRWHRSFTIASSGGHNGRVELTIKAGPGALATRWMQETLRPGDSLAARGPFGKFSLVYAPVAPLLLIGGGSGMTPMISMLRWLVERGQQHDVVLLQVARTTGDVLFTDEIAAMGRELPMLRHHVCLTRPLAGWQGLAGYFSRSLLRRVAADASRRIAFCCGPEPLMDAAQAAYLAEGGGSEAFVTEAFGPSSGAGARQQGPIRLRPAHAQMNAVSPVYPATAPVTSISPIPEIPVAESKAPEGNTMIQFRGRVFPALAGQSIVASVAAQGLRIPTSCGKGSCGTCRIRLSSGEVNMRDDGGLSRKDREAGYILACCSFAKTNLVLADI